MSYIKLFKQYVVAGFNKKIVFLNGSNCWSYEIQPDLPLEKCRPKKYFDADSDSDEDSTQQQQPQKQNSNGNTTASVDKVQIVALEVHEEQSLLAVATSDKSLYLFEIVTGGDGTEQGTLKLLSRRMVSRTSSCMKFAASGKFLVVCDKGGDCYRYDCDEDCKKPGRWLLGHMSQVLDVLVSADEKLIITSDRDEKIRVTNHPECHTIETFCLGHGEFVSQLEFVAAKDDKPCLLSLSGDKTLRLWDYTTGKEIARKDLTHPGNRVAVKPMEDGGVLVAVLFYEPTEIGLYKLNEVESLKGESIQTLKTKKDEVFSNFAFDDQSNLLALVVDKVTEKVSLKMYEFEQENCKFSEQTSNSLVETFSTNTVNDKLSYVDSVSFLFKKKFDNLKDYQERKRRRIEEGGK